MAIEKGVGSSRWEREFDLGDTLGEVVLRAENLTKRFGDLIALDGVDFEVRQNEFVSLIGPNGAGKTSLLNCINKFYEPDQGRIIVGDTDITGYRPDQVAAAGIARTFQNVELFGDLSTVDNIKMGEFIRRKAETPWWHPFYPVDRNSRADAEEIIELLRLEGVRSEEVGELPFGTRKIIDLGRALIAQPEVLLLDEPSAGLSVEEKEDMFRYLLEVKESTGMAVVLVEHDTELVVDLSDRIVVMTRGQKAADGPPDDVMNRDVVVEAYLGES